MRKTHRTALITGLLLGQTGVTLAVPASERISVTVRGKGPDVVLIPGLACSNAVWDATAKRLEGRFRLHLVQVAGFAGSPAGANAQGPVLQPTMEALHAYIKTNQLKAPKVIGHSMGGLMGLMLAAQHPEDESKLLVVDALPFFGAIMGAADTNQAAPQATIMRDSILGQTQDTYAQSERFLLHSFVKSPEGYKAATPWAIASDKSVVARAFYDCMMTDLRPTLSTIKTPVTVLYAWDASSPVPQATIDKLYQESYAPLPNKTLVRIDNSLHFIMFDQPEAFATQVDAFLK
jgi:pimeloyl-ACP methyl ester carboxylesterase